MKKNIYYWCTSLSQENIMQEIVSQCRKNNIIAKCQCKQIIILKSKPIFGAVPFKGQIPFVGQIKKESDKILFYGGFHTPRLFQLSVCATVLGSILFCIIYKKDWFDAALISSLVALWLGALIRGWTIVCNYIFKKQNEDVIRFLDSFLGTHAQ